AVPQKSERHAAPVMELRGSTVTRSSREPPHVHHTAPLASSAHAEPVVTATSTYSRESSTSPGACAQTRGVSGSCDGGGLRYPLLWPQHHRSPLAMPQPIP